MIVFPELLIGPAEEAGIKVPEDIENYDPEIFPYWKVFCNVQLGAPLPNSLAHWNNAKIIASIPQDKIKEITYPDLLEMGLEVGEYLI